MNALLGHMTNNLQLWRCTDALSLITSVHCVTQWLLLTVCLAHMQDSGTPLQQPHPMPVLR